TTPAVASKPHIGTLQGLPEAVLVREPQNLPGVSRLARGGNVFAVSVASSPAEAEQRQAGGRRAPNRSFAEAEFCRISGASRARFSAALNPFMHFRRACYAWGYPKNAATQGI